jgi:hypothetical protein
MCGARGAWMPLEPDAKADSASTVQVAAGHTTYPAHCTYIPHATRSTGSWQMAHGSWPTPQVNSRVILDAGGWWAGGGVVRAQGAGFGFGDLTKRHLIFDGRSQVVDPAGCSTCVITSSPCCVVMCVYKPCAHQIPRSDYVLIKKRGPSPFPSLDFLLDFFFFFLYLYQFNQFLAMTAFLGRS